MASDMLPRTILTVKHCTHGAWHSWACLENQVSEPATQTSDKTNSSRPLAVHIFNVSSFLKKKIRQIYLFSPNSQLGLKPLSKHQKKMNIFTWTEGFFLVSSLFLGSEGAMKLIKVYLSL